MKKYFGVLLLLLIIVVGAGYFLIKMDIIKLPGYGEKAESIGLSQNEIGVRFKKSYQLYSFIYPEKANKSTIVYESSNPDIVDVNSITGYITAKKVGTATIIAKLANDESIQDSCVVYVSKKNILVNDLTTNVSEVNLSVGNTFQLKYQITPVDANVHDVEYISSDSKIVDVNSEGLITGKSGGRAIVTISEKATGIKKEVVVTVYGESINNDNTVEPKDIKVDDSNILINVGGDYDLNAMVLPDDANQKLTYTSVNENIGTVSGDGIVKGNSKGETKIVIKTVNGIEKIVNLKVQEDVIKVTKISLNENKLSMYIGDEKKVKVSFSPSNATNQGVTWRSDNDEVADVVNGKITGRSVGTTDIYAISNDGNYEAKVSVTVKERDKVIYETDLVLSSQNVNIKVNESSSINVSYVPSNTTNQRLTWTSDNSSIATVSDGLIVGKNPGTTRVYVKSSSNKVTKTINVTVSSIEVERVELSESSITLNEGDTETLIKTIKPSNATNKSVTWTSSDSSVASVDGNGLVEARSVGTATITVRTNNGKTAKCMVKVNKRQSTTEVIEVSGVVLNNTNASLYVGEELVLTAKVEPSNASNRKVTWTSSNTGVARVSNGQVEAVGAGTATITAKTNNGKTATCKITVSVKTVDVTEITLNKSSANIYKGDKLILTATISPSNATNKNITWTSSNTSVATVSGGNVTSVGVGETVITAKTNNGKTATCKVTVLDNNIEVTGITLNKSSASLYKGDKLILTATLNPSNATNKNITWTSSNTSVATVSGGNVTSVGVGETIITAKTNNGKTATCKVTVSEKEIAAQTIIVSKTELSLYVSDSETITATITPVNTTNKTVTWTSSNTSVAAVSGGKIVAKGVGSATITAKTSNGKTATCKVTVSDKVINVTKISLDKLNATIQVGSKVTLKATIEPSNATNKTVTWTSSNTKVATVDSKGVVTGKSVGSAVIKATSNNGKQSACTVTVTKKGVNLRVATFNIGMYKCGTSKVVRCSTTAQDLATLIKNNKIDIIGIQEATPKRSTEKLASELGYNNSSHFFYSEPNNANAVISKYAFVAKKSYGLKSCRESREIERTVVNINGVDISFYVTHFSYQSECHDVHFASAAERMKDDPNPIILTGDFNIDPKSWYEKYFKPMGFEIAGRDDKRSTYMDAIYVLPKGHISTNGYKVVQTYGTYTDHNLVIADLIIY